ncbi:MFS transporter [Sporanaerobium hydrogeniformans]|uniref:MFS transporter n=1 Tax=Sporanaerobium hydrogeniformans TaxID=3072179 RepID=A0AC61DFJ7_9FIRM|nr:pyridoxamine 5'-phosphate oxidase family protein [Sporanaerobium hydrogeniformans]PHV71680.1 MFS transporter [Sporanaerobium hydrogeniformans]
MKMRRADREITDVTEILKIIDACKVCRMAMVEQGKPYIVPLNFGYTYQEGRFEFYFHSALRGRKLDILQENPVVCLELDGEHQLIEGDIACRYSFLFASVIAEGEVTFIEELEEKKKALNVMMKHITGKTFVFEDKHAKGVAVFKVTVTAISAKARRK